MDRISLYSQLDTNNIHFLDLRRRQKGVRYVYVHSSLSKRNE